MSLELWRGGRHLGDLVLELPAPNAASVAGVFRPTAAFADLSPVMQVHSDLGSTQPVLQFPLADGAMSGEDAIRALSAEQAAGLAAERWFELRDERGQSVPWRLITLDRLPRAPKGQEDPIEIACRVAGVEYSGWYVHAVLRPPLVAA